MQRTQPDGVIISCDFCGVDWDPYDTTYANPMVEGHHGSVMCLACLKRALTEMAIEEGEYTCTMCIQRITPDVPRWSHPSPAPSPGLNEHAAACKPCIRQAAGRFHKDKDVDWRWIER